MLFGFVTEGATDQAILKNILYGLFDTDDIDFTSLAPILDETGKSKPDSYAGWQLVLEFCTSDKFQDSFDFIDYLIIQIDTDVSEQKGFDIKHTRLNEETQTYEELLAEELIQKVTKFLKHKISLEIYEEYQEQIILAISVHSIECWLLPIFLFEESEKNNKKLAKIKNCLGSLNQSLQAQTIKTCDPQLDQWLKKTKRLTIRDKKDTGIYEQISSPYAQREYFLKLVPKNNSLQFFVAQLIQTLDDKELSQLMLDSHNAKSLNR